MSVEQGSGPHLIYVLVVDSGQKGFVSLPEMALAIHRQIHVYSLISLAIIFHKAAHGQQTCGETHIQTHQMARKKDQILIT